MKPLQLHLLGDVRFEQGNNTYVEHLPGKALALLCYLAVTGEAQTREVLAGLFWSDFPEHRARGNLRDTLTALRRTPLAPFVISGRRVVSFNRDLPYWLDTAEFQKGVEQGIQGMSGGPSALQAATELYGGEFMVGFHISKAVLFEEWVTAKRQEFHLLAVDALQQLVDFHLDAASYDAGIPHARRLLPLDPWREQSHRNLMLFQLLNGQHSAALAQYEKCRNILTDDLGVMPSQETQTLFQNIRKHVDTRCTSDTIDGVPDTLSKSSTIQHNIRGQPTPFFGRLKEQRAIDNVLSDRSARMITIFGVGGIGKTRIALAIAEKQIRAMERDGEFRFVDGVYFVPLEAVESANEILHAICESLGFKPIEQSQGGRSVEEQLLGFLYRKRLLLVVDNFEHLMDGAGLLANIHRSAPGVHLLVTSRQKLGLQGERLYALDGLSYPQTFESEMNCQQLLDQYSAPALFASIARRVQSDFVLREDEIAPLIRLCQLVDGLPLAIEVAAGWMNVLSLNDILAEIEQGLSFLESDLKDLPDRHHSMEAVFDATWRQLTQAEQSIFARLCVFQGGFTRLAAEQITGATIRQLAVMVNKAMIQYDTESNRYRIHRLLHQFGSMKLVHNPEEEKLIRNRHCAFYCLLLQQWDMQLKEGEQQEALAAFEEESANVRSAWNYSIDSEQFNELDESVDSLGRLYLWRRRFHSGEVATRQAAARLMHTLNNEDVGENTAQVMRILAKIKIWQSIFNDREEADQLIVEVLELLDSDAMSHIDTQYEKAFGLQRAGDLVHDIDAAEALNRYRSSLSLYKRLDDTWRMTTVLTTMGWAAAHLGETAQARQFGEEAFALTHTIGNQKRRADALWLLGTLSILAGEIDEASHLLGESLDIREKLGDRIADIASGPIDLGMTLTWIGRMTDAVAVRDETLASIEAKGQPEQLGLAHVRLAFSQGHIGQFDLAQKHADIGLELCRTEGDQRGAGLALFILSNLAMSEGEIDRAKHLMQECVTSFRGVEGATEIGWAFAGLAISSYSQGQLDVSKDYLRAAFHTASGLLGMITILMCLGSYTQILVDEGKIELAIEMGSLMEKYPISGKSKLFLMHYEKRLAEIKTTLPEELVKAAESRGHQRDLLKTAASILAELEENTGD